MDPSPLLGALASVMTGLVALYRRQKGGARIRLRDVPWRAFRRLFYLTRRYFVPVEKPDAPTITTGMGVDEVEDVLGKQFFNPDWPLSYYYHGEDYNGRRYYHAPDRKYPHRQVHVRGFEQDDGSMELMAHDEPAPEHHPKAHLREHNMAPANEQVKRVLDAAK